MSDDLEDPIELELASPEPPARIGHNSLVIAALIIPVLAGVAVLFLESVEVAVCVAIASVFLSSLLVAIDAYQLGDMDPTGRLHVRPWILFIGMCGLWVFCFPLAFFRRLDFGRPNFAVAALLVTLFNFGAPFAQWVFFQSGLPACNSRVVKQLVEQLVRQSPAGAGLRSVDGFQETQYDREAALRHGHAVAHTDNGDIPVNFSVSWRNRERSEFEVRIPPPDLPNCDSPEIVNLLMQVIRQLAIGEGLTSISDYKELSYDAKINRRIGQCVLHTEEGDVPVQYIVEWQDHAKGLVRVQTLPGNLPACNSKTIIKLLDKLLRDAPAGAKFESSEGHQEVSYDAEAKIRHGECLIHTEDGDAQLLFDIFWDPKDKNRFLVKITEVIPQ